MEDWKILTKIDAIRGYKRNDEWQVNRIKKLLLEDEREKHKNLSTQLDEWMESQNDEFNLRDAYVDLHIMTDGNAKKAVQAWAHRRKDADVIESVGNRRSATYRKVRADAEPVKWWKADGEVVDVSLPFGLNDKCGLYNGDVMVVSGEKDMGKTSFAMNFAYKNRDKFETQYLCSEMWDDAIKGRIDRFVCAYPSMKYEEWRKIIFKTQRLNIEDLVKPGYLNVIDYLELDNERPFVVGNQIARCFDRLDGKGLVLICLQQDPGKDFARGGTSTLDKSRLYIKLTKPGTITIEVAKTLLNNSPPLRGQVMHYNIEENGVKFALKGDWHHKSECTELSCGIYGTKKDKFRG